MLSLLCRSALHSYPSSFISTALAVATAGRLRYSSTTDPEWSPTRQYKSKEGERIARHRATDPEYRERLLAYQAAQYQKHRLRRLAETRAFKAQHADEIRAKHVAAMASRDVEKLYNAPRRARWASDDRFKQKESLRVWVRQSWVRDLTWRTHRPIFSEKTVRYCGGCGITRSLTVWWQDNKTDEFLCHSCFTSDWSRALPIGYEDKVFGDRPYKQSKPTTGDKPGPDA